jgi:hypothetical protein
MFAVHLPRLCQKPLQECLNCGVFGHTWNFCHRGAQRLRPDYQYFALCHNCQKWHLPIPCKEELVQCGGCMQLGHVQEYCALNPTPSTLFTGNMVNFISHDLNSDNIQWILHNAALADEIYKIKMEAVSDTLQLSTGRNQEEVRDHLARIYRGPQRPSPTSYRPASTQLSAARQLPMPAATAKPELNSLPRSSIPQVQGHEHSHEDNNTLATLQLYGGDEVSRLHTEQVVAAPSVQNTSTEPQHSLGFRTYDDNGDRVQVELGGESSGNGDSSPGSSPCDDRANSVESKEEVEQEREFLDGGVH